MTDQGRPTKYESEYDAQAAKLCELGATDMELADFFNVSLSTLHLWKLKHPSFSDSLKVGKDKADERVKRSLYNRAVGYTYESEKIFHNSGEIVRASTREHVPPDIGAAMSWLKNRCRDEWVDSDKPKETVININISKDDAGL